MRDYVRFSQNGSHLNAKCISLPYTWYIGNDIDLVISAAKCMPIEIMVTCVI